MPGRVRVPIWRDRIGRLLETANAVGEASFGRVHVRHRELGDPAVRVVEVKDTLPVTDPTGVNESELVAEKVGREVEV